MNTTLLYPGPQALGSPLKLEPVQLLHRTKLTTNPSLALTHTAFATMNSAIYYALLSISSYILLTLTLFAMSIYLPTIPVLGFAARLLASYASLLLCATYGVLASIALRLFGKHRLAQWAVARSFDLVMRYTTGVRFVIVEGERCLTSKRPMVIIGNHQTELDVLFLGRIFPKYCSVTAKKSLARVPFLGWFMSLSGTVFIDRVDRSQAMKAFEGAAREMKEHRQNVFIFPEGTRSYAREPIMLPFKKGAFHLAVQAGVDICPVVAENYSRVLDVRAKRFVGGMIRVKGEGACCLFSVSELVSSTSC